MPVQNREDAHLRKGEGGIKQRWERERESAELEVRAVTTAVPTTNRISGDFRILGNELVKETCVRAYVARVRRR